MASATLLILEDNPERQKAMLRRCEKRGWPLELLVFPDAPSFIEHVSDPLRMASAVGASLDHDLYPDHQVVANLSDPGDGRQVAENLANLKVPFPVIVHSANENFVPTMMNTLTESGVTVRRVSPYGDLRWIRETWTLAVEELVIPRGARSWARAGFPAPTISHIDSTTGEPT